jgi:hypothetical protein
MPELSGFPYAEIQFDRDAKVVGSLDEVLALANGPSTDLIVMSHGWNNDARDARELYKQLAASLRDVLRQDRIPALRDRKIALVGVVWPSMKFADDDGNLGGAAGAGSPVDTLELVDQINELRKVFTSRAEKRTLDAAAALVPQLEDSADARREFAELLKTLLDRDAVNDEDASTDLVEMDGAELMDRLAQPILIPAPPGDGQGGAAGGVDAGAAAGFGDLLRGPLGAAKKLANFVTYFEMKARSGNIGARGVAPVVARIKQSRPDLNVHLLGHSFGARLVAATAGPLPRDSIATMSLLQGAFSHHGFARDFEPGQSGFFRDVIDDKTVRGPTVITKTANDKAVGLAYAIASRVANDAASGVGDAADKFGGIGRNGAVKTAEAVDGRLLAVGGAYSFRPRTLHNLLADEFIRNHSDVKGKEVAYAVLSAIGAS